MYCSEVHHPETLRSVCSPQGNILISAASSRRAHLARGRPSAGILMTRPPATFYQLLGICVRLPGCMLPSSTEARAQVPAVTSRRSSRLRVTALADGRRQTAGRDAAPRHTRAFPHSPAPGIRIPRHHLLGGWWSPGRRHGGPVPDPCQLRTLRLFPVCIRVPSTSRGVNLNLMISRRKSSCPMASLENLHHGSQHGGACAGAPTAGETSRSRSSRTSNSFTGSCSRHDAPGTSTN